MIDPIIFEIKLGPLNLALHWYGLLIAVAVIAGAWFTARRVQATGSNPEFVSDALLWVLPAAVIGARLWYVVNDILGGNPRYLQDPVSILWINQGGLHIFGAVLLGGLAAYAYARRSGVNLVMLLDSVAPALLIGQALARPANFINQELYGPPTTLPWGIPISAERRLAPWNDLGQFPLETTRFHPTFAYEMVWNFLAAGLMLWLERRYAGKFQPGTMFALWLVLAGLGRFLIEAFRPDQPRLPGLDLSYSRLISALMVLAGAAWLAWKYARRGPATSSN